MNVAEIRLGADELQSDEIALDLRDESFGVCPMPLAFEAGHFDAQTRLSSWRHVVRHLIRDRNAREHRVLAAVIDPLLLLQHIRVHFHVVS